MIGDLAKMLTFVLLFTGAAESAVAESERDAWPNVVSIVSLIVNGAGFDREAMVVRGVFFTDGDSAAIYLNRESLELTLDENAIYLITDDIQDLAVLNGKYVLVEGVFDSSDKGVTGIFAGTLNSIVRIHPTPGESLEIRDQKCGQE